MTIQGEPVAHNDLVNAAATGLHKHILSASDPATGPVDFAKQQATALVIENRVSDPATPANGQIWLRTDL